jgi:hypothetical protein
MSIYKNIKKYIKVCIMKNKKKMMDDNKTKDDIAMSYNVKYTQENAMGIHKLNQLKEKHDPCGGGLTIRKFINIAIADRLKIEFAKYE